MILRGLTVPLLLLLDEPTSPPRPPTTLVLSGRPLCVYFTGKEKDGHGCRVGQGRVGTPRTPHRVTNFWIGLCQKEE